jgi:hypothetical protein
MYKADTSHKLASKESTHGNEAKECRTQFRSEARTV